MHNAATIAGMAFANAFLGVNHSMAHKIGGEWHIPHGRANGILLPHVIRYNGTVPTKLNVWPKIENYKADKKYRELAELIGLHPKTDAEGVEMFAQAVEQLWVNHHRIIRCWCYWTFLRIHVISVRLGSSESNFI